MPENDAAKEPPDRGPGPPIPEKHGDEMRVVIRVCVAVFIRDIRRIVHKVVQPPPNGKAYAIAVASVRWERAGVRSQMVEGEPLAVDDDIL